ncbi:MAG: c-type cytochrome [Candidatus Hydrogenedentota bacterium]
MRGKIVCITLMMAFAPLWTFAANVTDEGGAGRLTFTKDVLPILQENCQSCHRPQGANLSGMIAPMSLMTYEEVRPWAKAIARSVEAKAMPPWDASQLTHGVFKNERTLTDDQIATIASWVSSGAARGNSADAPAPKLFENTGWQLSDKLGEPDMLLKMNEPFWVADEVRDIQPRIEIKLTKEQMPEKRWVRAIEYRPGSEVVHHVVGYSIPPGEDDNFTNGSNFGQIASGTDPQNYEEGYGLPLLPESKIVLSMHYHKEIGPGTGAYDQTELAVWFHDKPVSHVLESSPIAHGDFEIPPMAKSWRVGGAKTWDDDFVVLELLPHMHLRGSAAKYTAYYPDGTSEVLLDVPKYLYEWQTSYEYANYKHMPAGTRVEWEIRYDNSPEMAAERNFDSNLAVRFGGPTTDEMDLGWMTWCYAKEGKAPDSYAEKNAEHEDSHGTD